MRDKYEAYDPIEPSCESDSSHTGHYCEECSTCHQCVQEQVEQVKQLQRERDEIKESLGQANMELMHYRGLLGFDSNEALAKLQAKAVEDAIESIDDDCDDINRTIKELQDYAAKLRGGE